MKKIIAMICCAFAFMPLLSACFDSTIYPDMVEYSESEVLSVAKEKYDVRSFIFTDKEFHGEKGYDADMVFTVSVSYSAFGTDFINGDNIEGAFTAFAGKNGGHDIQGMYANFLCYVALGIDTDGEAKFIYYNLNLNKDAAIVDTIGCSDYPFDVLPTEVTNAVLTPPSDWGAMTVYMNKHFKNITSFGYAGERLSCGYNDGRGERVALTFYKEDGRVVYDMLYFEDAGNGLEPQLVYSTSERYGVIYNHFGLDMGALVDVEYTVTQSTEDPALDLLKGSIKLKPVDGKIVYCELTMRASYKVTGASDGFATREDVTRYREVTEVEKGYLLDRLEGVDHRASAKVMCQNLYVLYEKNV